MDENLDRIVTSLRRIQTEGDSASNFVIFIADAEKNYYIQFTSASDASALYAEAVGNNFLARECALNSGQIAHLQCLGWNLPTDSPNFFREWVATDDDDRLLIAREVMRTFSEVYRISPDRPIAVELEIG